MKWEDVLKRDDIVGGDLEMQETGAVSRGPMSNIVIRGPISSIELVDDNQLIIETAWTARLVPTSGEGWKPWPMTGCMVDTSQSRPSDIGSGRISFGIPKVGFAIIFPKGGSKLDPSKVEGLVIPPETAS